MVIDDVGVIPCGYPNPLLQPRMGILFLASYLGPATVNILCLIENLPTAGSSKPRISEFITILGGIINEFDLCLSKFGVFALIVADFIIGFDQDGAYSMNKLMAGLGAYPQCRRAGIVGQRDNRMDLLNFWGRGGGVDFLSADKNLFGF